MLLATLPYFTTNFKCLGFFESISTWFSVMTSHCKSLFQWFSLDSNFVFNLIATQSARLVKACLEFCQCTLQPFHCISYAKVAFYPFYKVLELVCIICINSFLIDVFIVHSGKASYLDEYTAQRF